jgi:hypothetical protein
VLGDPTGVLGLRSGHPSQAKVSDTQITRLPNGMERVEIGVCEVKGDARRGGFAKEKKKIWMKEG